MSGKSVLRRLDWLTVFLYLLLVFFGWVNIYSTTLTEAEHSIFDFGTLYGKQLFFIMVSMALVVIILSLETSFFERFSSLFYLFSIVLLIGLYPFGKTIAGATSWYGLGFFNLQPSEFAKMATALALAKYLCDIQTDIRQTKHQLFAILIIVIPILLIVPQPDPGSALIYFSLMFVLFREGLPLKYLGFALLFGLLFVCTLKFGVIWVCIGLGMLISLFFFVKRNNVKIPKLPLAIFLVLSVLLSLSVEFVFENVFEQRHRDRFSLWLGLEDDPAKLEQIKKTIGYNTYQAEKAIESGGFLGKGFLEGTRTKGDFVPEQHTDYIFSSVGEEWGFLGTALIIVVFSILFLRLIHLAERQKKDFSRMYGYGIVSILLVHYFVNIGMVIGLLPTIGIPLPFFSYGGSGLLFFTAMLFVFLKMDTSRLNEV
ncbi:Rod shape-determining protein RodA [Croceitalea dokdonensis DOKDO 023]|uniref:Rod shape-determining protein RodA n=1 Tax=Croceitalea dokdonensis DOKDO 023 TaxID=1300341 RepID=A0A0P7AVL2_9FLAO|nr:rod shape-determining protein RodA [Croceitalea dokdonensis]KPM32648.1 Rod shape-determining protein RodA [Croceitalea dokdonensis DOKDO 023]